MVANYGAGPTNQLHHFIRRAMRISETIATVPEDFLADLHKDGSPRSQHRLINFKINAGYIDRLDAVLRFASSSIDSLEM